MFNLKNDSFQTNSDPIPTKLLKDALILISAFLLYDPLDMINFIPDNKLHTAVLQHSCKPQTGTGISVIFYTDLTYP